MIKSQLRTYKARKQHISHNLQVQNVFPFVPFCSISLHKFSQKTQISVCSLKVTYGKPRHSTIVSWHQAQRMHLLGPALAAKTPEFIYAVPSIKLHTFSKRRFPNFWKKWISENDVLFCRQQHVPYFFLYCLYKKIILISTYVFFFLC